MHQGKLIKSNFIGNLIGQAIKQQLSGFYKYWHNRKQRMGKKIQRKPKLSSLSPESFNFVLPRSEYSIKYASYMEKEYLSVQILIKKIIKLPCCAYYYLRFPLEAMIKAICKKLMMNIYQVTIYGYFLSVCRWELDPQIFGNLHQLFPDLMHVNQPVDSQKLKELSMFLYFSCYSVKELLNSNMEIFLAQMTKNFPQFQHLHAYWVNNQPTTSFVLNPKILNSFFKLVFTNGNFVDYNVIIDKIIQISPCYDINPKVQNDKKGSRLPRNLDVGKQNKGSRQAQDEVKAQFISEQFQDFKIINEMV